MSDRSKLAKFLVGKKKIDSRIEYKQAMLRGQLSILLASVCTFYLVFDPLNGLYHYLPYYLVGVITAFIAIILNRKRKFTIASVTLLTITNIIVFIVADASRPGSGVYFFFPVMALIALVLFYHTRLKTGIGFVVIPFMLALVAYFNDNSLLEETILTGYNKDINFTINLMLGTFASVMVFLFVILRNKESEASLLENKARLEKLANELTIKNTELQKANDELDRFVYSASHDMRAPLSTLLGLIEVAKMSNNPDEIPQYYDMMTNRILDMEGFIREVTDYSRNTRLQVMNENTNLNKMLEGIKETFSILAKEAAVRIEIDVDENLEIYTDPTRLNVVLNNLIANAIKYNDPRKEDKYVKLSAVRENGLCTIDIEDNGIGIIAEYQDKIFDMFFRATEGSKGSGLGLYIVKETLEKLNGSIDFESNTVSGSKFTVNLLLETNNKDS